jgi:hypothetical protein
MEKTMGEKQLTQEPPKLIQRFERCKKRFEKIEKKSQQPWRNSAVAVKEETQKAIKRIDNLIPEVISGNIADEQAKTLLMILNTMAALMESELKTQNMQKSYGEEIIPFGQTE